MDKSFYVYGHFLNESDEVPFYIGKGKCGRAYSKRGRNSDWSDMAKDGFAVRIFKDNMSESDAYKLEVKLIKKYGRKDVGNGSLINRTPGGAGGIDSIATERMVPVELERFIKQMMFRIALDDYLVIAEKEV